MKKLIAGVMAAAMLLTLAPALAAEPAAADVGAEAAVAEPAAPAEAAVAESAEPAAADAAPAASGVTNEIPPWAVDYVKQDTEASPTETDGTAPDDGTAESAETPIESEPAVVPDEPGTVSFENLESRVRENNVSILALLENIASIDAVDYDQMRETLLKNIHSVAASSRYLSSFGIDTSSMASASQSLLEAWDALKEGEVQQEYADAKRQLEYVIDLTVQGAQTLYITIVTLEQTLEDGRQGLATLDRTITEMELRYQLGQIPELTLLQLKNTRANTVSQLETLELTIANLKAQLQVMIGEDPTGEITLMPLPEVTLEQLDAMDLETDLAQAQEASWTLYDAANTLDDAYDTYREDCRLYSTPATAYNLVMTEHTWQAAQYTYKATVQSFQLAFGQNFRTVKNDWSSFQAALSDYAFQQKNYAASETKYSLGTISYNELLNEKDSLLSAAAAVVKARTTLSQDYSIYRWAVERGIVNQ
ncbi:MAG: TolC family protein [Oscillospiraceae bacterium]|nr:TolC family protein [Oscillospiraceae bacterium]